MAAEPDASDPSHPHGKFRARVLLAMVRHHWFIRLRWMMAGTACVLLILERLQRPDSHRPVELVLCILGLAAVNVVWRLLGQGMARDIDRDGPMCPGIVRRVGLFANAQMTVDLMVLTMILRYSGGVENPMAVFYLFHVVIAAMLLGPFNSLLQGCWALVLYATLGFGECAGLITPHYPFLPSTLAAALHGDWTYVVCAIGVLGTGIFGTLYFTLQISSRLDEQERELQDANEALKHSRDAVGLLQERRSRFMQTAAHQLKSPLTGIEMLAGLIRDKVVPPGKIQATVARIIRRCQEAIVQVGELLTLERVEQTDKTRHRGAATDIVSLVESVVAKFADLAKSKKLTLRVDTASCRGVTASVDKNDLGDCVGNLLDNAVKYTRENGSIWITTTCDENSVSILVRDTGMGINTESEKHLFEPFRRGNQALAANIPGSGLGLAIVRGFVEQANGRIQLHSVVGEGSEFVLSIPRRDDPGAEAAVSDAMQSAPLDEVSSVV